MSNKLFKLAGVFVLCTSLFSCSNAQKRSAIEKYGREKAFNVSKFSDAILHLPKGNIQYTFLPGLDDNIAYYHEKAF